MTQLDTITRRSRRNTSVGLRTLSQDGLDVILVSNMWTLSHRRSRRNTSVELRTLSQDGLARNTSVELRTLSQDGLDVILVLNCGHYHKFLLSRRNTSVGLRTTITRTV